MIKAALAYARHGWRVLPLAPRDKPPITPKGCKDATTDEGPLRGWWAITPEANIGVATGQGSGIVVIDLDGPEGLGSWEQLEAEHGTVETLAQRTGRTDGGRQLFFRHPGGRVKNRTSVLPGIDVRGDGGYVVVPPSIHPSGNKYRWEAKSRPAEMPDWLVELITPKTPERRQTPRRMRTSIGTSAYGQRALEEECAAIRALTEGVRHTGLFHHASNVGELVAGGEIVESDAWDALVAAGETLGLERGEREVERQVRNGLESGALNPRSAPEDKARATAPRWDDDVPPPDDKDAPTEVVDSWRDLLLRTRHESIRAVVSNALIYARHHPELRGRLGYDERYLRAEWLSQPPWGGSPAPRPVVDADAVECARWLAHVEWVAFSESMLWTALVAEAQRNPFDKVREYLEGLEWDESMRIDGWLTEYLGVTPCEYTWAVAAAWLISGVARALCPGCQADHLLVLEGAQGAGKSRSLAAIGGPFYAELSIDPQSKDSTLAIHGPWIVEWAELAGLSRREAEATKAFLSRREDRVRPPYGRHTIDLPRRCIIAGSTNESIYVNDPTGNRRYWPVQVTQTDPDGLAKVRDQLWAEALYRYRRGDQWWLSPRHESLARSEQEERLEADAWEEPIMELLSTGKFSGRSFITTGQILEQISVPSSQQNSGTGRRIARIMSRLGLYSSRGRALDEYGNEGPRVRGYERPSPVGAEPTDTGTDGTDGYPSIANNTDSAGTDGTDSNRDPSSYPSHENINLFNQI